MKAKINPAGGIARWGDIIEYLAMQLISEKVKYDRDTGQPTLTLTDSHIQIIAMSGNNALGNIELPISSNCSKGIETRKKIDINKYRVASGTDMEVWILYYPSRKHSIYYDDNPNLICELARPLSYEIVEDGTIFPTNHDCRLMFALEGEVVSYVTEFADESVNEDYFKIEYKDASNE